MKKFKIIKSSGFTEDYSPEKLKRSLALSGLHSHETEDVINTIESHLEKVDEGTTEEIFKKARDVIYKKSHLAGLKYSLKAAILDLGPTGFVFERFIAKALTYQGFNTKVDLIYPGKCVNHEIDLVAQKDHYILLGECKFHNIPNVKNDLKTALYVKARMDDVRDNPKNQFNDFYLISNTSFSKDAIAYAKCSGLKLIGFNFPEERNLYSMIEENHLYPITSLLHVKKNDIQLLLEQGIILCKDLCEHTEILSRLGYSDADIDKILRDFMAVCDWKPR